MSWQRLDFEGDVEADVPPAVFDEKSPYTRNPKVTSVTAFHEKAGRSQVKSFVFFVRQGFLQAE
jgi:hypothetical protein